MTKDDIINLAHKAGFLIDTHAQQYQPNCILSTYGLIDENLERFATLVAAAEREKPRESASDYERGVIDGRQMQAQSSVDKAVNAMTQRPWIGLTDDDRFEIAAEQHGWEDLLIAAEARLKEKNNG